MLTTSRNGAKAARKRRATRGRRWRSGGGLLCSREEIEMGKGWNEESELQYWLWARPNSQVKAQVWFW